MLAQISGTTLLAVLVPSFVVILGGLIHVVYRLGRGEQKLTSLQEDSAELKEDVRDIRAKLDSFRLRFRGESIVSRDETE